jgi:hypothetical protein
MIYTVSQTHPVTNRETVWQAYWKLARLLFVDCLLFLTVLSVLLIGFFALKLLQVTGYPTEYVEFFEKIHVVAYGALFVIFVIDLFMKVVAAIFGEDRA